MKRSGSRLTGILADADLSQVADLMTAHRATILLALIGGRPLSAGQLAERAGISPPLASSHLAKLLDGGLVTVEQRGRERHYRLAGPHVAEAIEAMLTLAPQRSATSLRESTRGRAIRLARTCYDHLAGEVGVSIHDALAAQRLLDIDGDGAYRLTEPGERRLADLGLDVPALRAGRRAFARPCLDWTERRPHLAGGLGAGLAARLFELEWVTRLPGTRAVRLTEPGRTGLRDALALNLPG